jgi:hypothetical protein
MLDTTTHPQKPHPLPMQFAPRSTFNARRTNRLERANLSRDARLLDASIAGIVLSFNPRDNAMREKAALSWQSIRLLLDDQLFAENAVLPWHADASVGSATASDILKRRYLELRSLARTIATVSFEVSSDAEISSAGKALCRLAVKLDDLMEGAGRRLMDTLRHYVFSSADEHRLSA